MTKKYFFFYSSITELKPTVAIYRALPLQALL